MDKVQEKILLESEFVRAAAQGDWDQMAKCLDQGADIDAVFPTPHVGYANYSTESNETAVSWAVYRGWKYIVKLLLDHGADINFVIKSNSFKKMRGVRSALSCAVETNRREMVELLLDKGALTNPNNDNAYGSALVIAAELGLKDLTALLLDRGAAIDFVGSDNETALGTAARCRHTDIVKILPLEV